MDLRTFLMPVIVLVIWTLVVWVWMYSTRIPAMIKANVDPQQAVNPRGGWRDALPKHVNWVSDNYNHLHEQPTAFYALMIVLAIIERSSSVALIFAWLYVGLRIAHSLSQIIGNRVILRFGLFFSSSISLIALAFCAIV